MNGPLQTEMSLQSLQNKAPGSLSQDRFRARHTLTCHLKREFQGHTLNLALKVTCHADGTTDKSKSRLVVLGYLQRAEDYEDTFAHVVDFTIVGLQLALALAQSIGAHAYHHEVTGAFLHRELQGILGGLEGIRNVGKR
jgi:Reverse transcriptase (RNA-dependent DNA polymerase)